MSSLSSTDTVYNFKLIRKLANQAYPNNQVMADLLVTQAIVEGDILNLRKKSTISTLAWKYNNLFGITSKGTKGYITMSTNEFINGKEEIVSRKFGWNATVEDSIKQRKELFQNGTSDNPNRYQKVLAAPTVEQACNALLSAGYATNPSYAKNLIAVYHQYVMGK